MFNHATSGLAWYDPRDWRVKRRLLDRLLDWPWCQPVTYGVWAWLNALGIYARPDPVIPKQRTATSDETRETSTL